uniref:J domain-containing protein n=1 Tax=Rhabditophanes sp. KR3021 TaxID=114890 RepID=A0AC35U894_9BILA
MPQSLYELLGCDQSSDKEQIIYEYKILAKKYHPDKNESKCQVMFQQLHYAKEILTNDRTRKHYDNYLKMGSIMPLKEWMDNLDRIQQVNYLLLSKIYFVEFSLDNKNPSTNHISSYKSK